MTNLIKTPKPIKEKVRKAELSRFYPLLMTELKTVQPKRILAMGTAVAQCLCPGFSELREDHGTLFFNPDLNAVVVPTFPFAAIGRDLGKLPMLWRDVQRFKHLPDPFMPPYHVLDDFPLLPTGCDLYLDLETTGLNKETDRITLIGIGINDEDPLIIPVTEERPELFKKIHRYIIEAQATLIGHNLQFDLDWLQYKADPSRFWLDMPPVVDTMLVGHVSGEEVLALKHLSTMYTDRPGSRAFGGTTDYGYLAEDILSTREIRKVFKARGSEDAFAARLLNDLVPYVLEMRNRGVTLDYDLLTTLAPQYEEAVKLQTEHLNEIAEREVNWNASGQVVEFLLQQGVELTEKTEAGAYTVKESVMLELAKKYPPAQEILTLREKTKELEFFEDYLSRVTKAKPLIHPRLKLTGTRTGRLSCEDPNVQQVKRTGPIKLMYRSGFEGGYIGLVDLSQAELRIAALLAGDEKFIEALLSEDVHRELASVGFRKPKDQITSAERKKSKGVTFGLLYGGSPAGLAMRTGLAVSAVEDILDGFFHSFPKLMEYIEATKDLGVSQGFISTPTGRVRSLLSLIATKGEKDARRKAINTPIQGTASDVALIIMYNTARLMRSTSCRSRVIFGVHDSVLLDIHPEEVARVQYIVQMAFEAIGRSPLAELPMFPRLPMVGELVIGKTWAHVESTNENYDKEHNLTVPCTSLPTAEAIGGVISERDSDDPAEEEPEEEYEVIE